MALNPIQRLDEVLKIMQPKKNEAANTYNRREIHDELWKVPNITNEDVSETWNQLSQIINKLEKDGYIYHENVFRDEMKCYMITFEGELFNLYGGYSQELLDKAEKKANDERVATVSRRNEQRLVDWTRRLAYATIIAVLLLVSWELVKHYCLRWH